MSDVSPEATARINYADIMRVLQRNAHVAVLPSLIQAVKVNNASAALDTSAIIIDANAVLRIPGHRKSSDIIDYLGGVHTKPVVIPGQVIQEFWNNQLNATNTVYKNINNKANDLMREVTKAAGLGVTSTENISTAIEEFRRNNEHLFDPDLVQKTSLFLERLQNSALVPHAPRDGLYDLAMQRKLSKTPPGFKDDGDGDFLVWVDALWGLANAKNDGHEFDSVIILTNDKKIDWCRGIAAHPVLYAEMKAILGVHLEIWTLDNFSEALA